MPERFRASQGQFLETGSICTSLLPQGSLGYEEPRHFLALLALVTAVCTGRAPKVRTLEGSLFRKTERKINCANFGFRISDFVLRRFQTPRLQKFEIRNPKSQIVP
jgi:hypothetical protein